MSFNDLKIGFIGAGNMNSAIIGGLLNSAFSAEQIMASDPNTARLEELRADLGIQVTSDNADAARFADIVVLGVKPNYISVVCKQIKSTIADALVVSVAAGITSAQISRALGRASGIVRVMPNTPCLYQSGMVGLYADSGVDEQQRHYVTQLFDSIAELEWFADENEMDMVTALSGSGPAYFFHIAEAMISAAEAKGMSAAQAKHLVTQTMAGAATMLKESPLSAAELREAVTSPGGTTAAALETMYDGNLADILARAILAAEARGKAMSEDNDADD